MPTRYRMTHIFQEGYSANIDDRTLHEIYLWPFAEGVHAGVGAVMTAYNNVRTTFVLAYSRECAMTDLLTEC